MNWFQKYLDKEQAKRCLYWVIAAPIAFGLCMLVWYSSGFFLRLWKLICAVCKPIIVGGAIAYLLQPAVNHLSIWLARLGRHPDNPKRRMRLAVAMCAGALIIVIGLFFVVIAGAVTHSLSGVSLESLQEMLATFQAYLTSFIENLKQRLSELGIKLDFSGLDFISSAVGNVSDFFSNLFLGLIFSVYLLLDGDTVRRYVERVLYSLFGSHSMSRISMLMADADKVFSGYIRGQLIDAVVVGVLTGITFTLLGIPYGAVVGMLTGFGNLIPYVGGPVGYASVILVCLVDLQFDKMAAGVIFLTLIMLIDSNIINPRLLSENVEVHPLLVIAALIGGGALGGILGMLVAVPVAAFLKVQLDRWLEHKESYVEWADF